MSDRPVRLYLTDIVESGNAIQSYVSGIGFDQFSDDRMRCAAVVREFEIIGEAVAKLPEDLKAGYPEVSWRDIKDFRNLLIHEYFGVDLAIVWSAIHQELPPLIQTARQMLAES